MGLAVDGMDDDGDGCLVRVMVVMMDEDSREWKCRDCSLSSLMLCKRDDK